jgi:ABC-2 type transport system permease protein
MNTLLEMLRVEWLKSVRSRVPLFILAAFLFIPLGITFIMLIYKDPEAARAAGLLSVKANLLAGTADWPTFLSMLRQGTALGGYILFSFVVSWVFGREFADGTLKDMLAVPVSRVVVLLAKFGVAAAWVMTMVLIGFVISVTLGALMDLPLGSVELLVSGGLTMLVTALLVLAVAFPAALFASIGRGYLLPIGIAVLTLMLANVLAVAGWVGICPGRFRCSTRRQAGRRGWNRSVLGSCC